MKDVGRLVNQQGKIVIAALDHRGSFEKLLGNPGKEEIVSLKGSLVEKLGSLSSGVILDPVYGLEWLKQQGGWKKSAGLLMSLEKSGYGGSQDSRETVLQENWGVKEAKEAGADGVKLLVYFDPQNPRAEEHKEMVKSVSRACDEADLLFLLEPVSYGKKSKKEAVLAVVEEMVKIKADVYKFEYPGDREGCEQISRQCPGPWVLLSAGMEYEKYKESLQIACEAGASGMAVGRAVWQEMGRFHGEERERWLTETALARMEELVATVNRYGSKI